MEKEPLGLRIFNWIGDHIMPWFAIVALSGLLVLILLTAALFAFGSGPPLPVREYTLHDGTRCVAINGRGISCDWARP